MNKTFFKKFLALILVAFVVIVTVYGVSIKNITGFIVGVENQSTVKAADETNQSGGPTGGSIAVPITTPSPAPVQIVLPRVLAGGNLIYANDFETSAAINEKIPANLSYGQTYWENSTAQWDTNGVYVKHSPLVGGKSLFFNLTTAESAYGVKTEPIPLEPNTRYEINFYAYPQLKFVGNLSNEKFFIEFYILDTNGSDLIDHALFFGENDIELSSLVENQTIAFNYKSSKLPNGWQNITAFYSEQMPANVGNLIIFMAESSDYHYDGTFEIDNLVIRKA